MTVSLTAPEVIDAGFLTTDLVDETGTKILKVDYSGTFEGHEIWGLHLIVEGLDPDTGDAPSTLFYRDPVSNAFVEVPFHIRNFAALICQGSDGGDTIFGTTGSDALYGGDGIDSLYTGENGNDTLYGGAGNDFLDARGSAGTAQFYGGGGNDTLYGARLNDTVSGGAGFDIVSLDLSAAEEGIALSLNALQTGPNLTGVEAIAAWMTEHDDSLSMTLDLMAGRDLSQGPGLSFGGGKGEDTLILSSSAELQLAVHVTPDEIITAQHNNLWSGFPSKTVGGTALSGWEHLNITGSRFNDILDGGAQEDLLRGGAGQDTLYGRGGGGAGDTLYGGYGDDTLALGLLSNPDDPVAGGKLFGGDGNDGLSGSNGDDLLIGGAEVDFLFSYAGNDSLYGGSYWDFLYGGEGNDQISGGSNTDEIDGGLGADTAFGDAGSDTLSGDADRDLLYGGLGNDVLYGGSHGDTLIGGSDDDWLSGEAGDDRLYGGGGKDTLTGGYNADTLSGGAADDTFYFEGNRGSGSNLITDFEAGDVLQFGGGLSAADVTLGDAGKDLLVVWNTGTALLQGMAGQSVTLSFGELTPI